MCLWIVVSLRLILMPLWIMAHTDWIKLLDFSFYILFLPLDKFVWLSFFLAKSLLCQYISGYLSLSTFFVIVENLWSLSFCLVGSKKIWWECKKMVNNYFNLNLFCFIFFPILSERQRGRFWTIFGKLFIFENLKYILCFGFFYLLIHL